MKYFGKALIVIGVLSFLVGCGGGGGSGGDTPVPVDPMTQRQGIFIFYHLPEEDCLSPDFQNYMYNYMQGSGYQTVNYLFRTESLDVTCASYGKTNDFNQAGGCMTYDMIADFPDMIQYKSSCVIGMDMVTTAQASDLDNQALIPDNLKALVADYILDVMN